MPPPQWADLHLHTRWSDGTLPLDGMVKRGAGVGLSAIAITDHDTIGPDLLAPVTWIDGIEVICGVEVKADVVGQRGEILGYFLNPDHPELAEIFGWMARQRHERMRAMVLRCQEVAGAQFSLGDVLSASAGSVGRPHLAALLIQHRLAVDYQDAFQRFLAHGAPCYVPLPRPASRQVIAAIRAAGGVASLAHPCFLSLRDWRSTLSTLIDEGMEAVEVYYPYEASRQPLQADPAGVATLAHDLGLIPTGGSDDHGPGSVKDAIGAMRVPYSPVVEALRSLAGSVT